MTPPRPPPHARTRLETLLEQLARRVDELRRTKGTTPGLRRRLAEIARTRDARGARIQHHPNDVAPPDLARGETRRDRERR